ncbi:MAG: dCMP deaminase [Thermosediminibacterales bacterium]|nr:dCMP deaminase [Thermosediminibacterales bacterium]MDK2836027.1 dCMP deaminase [Thermosediminibacterales bacterium]
MSQNRISWHDYFMLQAKTIALRSTCTRLMVGCLITRDNRVIAAGYNGSVSGDVHCIDVGCKLENGHCVRTIHAEANAILQCAKFGISTNGADIYVTHFPCLNCTKMIIQAGIKNLYYETDYRVDSYALELLKNSKVSIYQIKTSFEDYFPLSVEKKEFLKNILNELKTNSNPQTFRKFARKASRLFNINMEL